MDVEYLVDQKLPKEITEYKIDDKINLDGKFFRAFGDLPEREQVPVIIVGSFKDYHGDENIVVIPIEEIFKSKAVAVLPDGTKHKGIWIVEPQNRDWLTPIKEQKKDDNPMWLLKTLW